MSVWVILFSVDWLVITEYTEIVYYLAVTIVSFCSQSADEDENLDLPKRDPVVLKKDKKYEDFYDSAEELGK